jgi:hypothetical protein
MATLNAFQIILPPLQGNDVNGNPTAQDQIIDTFLSSLASVSSFAQNPSYYITDSSGNITQWNAVTGNITNAQGVTVEGYINTLNSALGYNVPCIHYIVTTYP